MKKLFISCPMKDRTEAQIRGTMMQIEGRSFCRDEYSTRGKLSRLGVKMES